MQNKPEPQALLDTLKDVEKQKVKLTPEIEKEIREHLADMQARAERGEPMTREMAEFMENVRLWVAMPEEWRSDNPDLKSAEEIKKDPEVINLTKNASKEAKKRHISVGQWLDLLHVANANGKKDKKEWIEKQFACLKVGHLGDGTIYVDDDLYLHDCTKLRKLPTRLEVNRNLFLDGCTGLTRLPDELRVEWGLSLVDCTRLTGLPTSLEVGTLVLSQNLNEQVKRDAERLKKEGKIGEIKYS